MSHARTVVGRSLSARSLPASLSGARCAQVPSCFHSRCYLTPMPRSRLPQQQSRSPALTAASRFPSRATTAGNPSNAHAAREHSDLLRNTSSDTLISSSLHRQHRGLVVPALARRGCVRGCRMLSAWLDQVIRAFNDLFPPNTFFNIDFQVRGTLAVLLFGLACGAVGSLVVGNRMAFFSDALAHCAFAGVALGLLVALIAGVHKQDEFYDWILPIMVAFGVLVGLLIAFVRQKTNLANDTVIGVFFAGAMG